jgi:type II secretory pathway pseudopilin PulG
MRAGRRQPAGQDGFTYLGALFLLSLMGLGLAGTGQAWEVSSRRDRERELLWVGNQYARAIKAYHEQSPGARQYPQQVQDLLEDRRFPVPRHHLRKQYLDPVARGEFVLVRNGQGRIAGVRSASDEAPMKRSNFRDEWKDFEGVTRYSDWQFVVDESLRRQLKQQR